MTRPKQVLLLGASVRALAQSAVAAGFECIACDLFGDADLCSVASKTLVLNRADYPTGFVSVAEQCRGIPRVYTGGLENFPDVITAMAQSGPLWGNAASVLADCRDPFELQRRCPQVGLHFPKTMKNGDSVPTDGSWLTKPLVGSGGMGIQRWLGQADPRGCVFQQFMAGEPRSLVVSMLNGKARIVGLSHQLVNMTWLNAPDHVFCGSIPIAVDETERCRVHRLTRLLESFPLRGLVNVDYLDDGQSITVLEINPRWSASMELFETSSEPLFARHVEDFVADGQVEHALIKPRFAKAILFAPADGARISEELFSVWPGVADIPRNTTAIRRGDPVVSLRVPIGSTDETLDRLRSLAEEVQAKLWPQERA